MEPDAACFRVVTRGSQGRVCVATRLIRAGTVILSEQPLVIAPEQPDKGGCATCLGCCVATARPVACPGCGGPLCSAACAPSPYHQQECSMMRATGFRFASPLLSASEYSMLGFLRVLLLEGEAAARCRLLEAHAGPNASSHMVEWQMGELAPRLIPCMAAFSKEKRVWAYSVMQTNSFSYEEHNVVDPRNALVLMDALSMFAHSCVCNSFGNCYSRPEAATGWAALLGLRKVLVAATDIAPGEDITVSYEHPHLPTPLRQASLLRTKHFRCQCPRCLDPAELGLHTGALCCTACMRRGDMQLPVPRRPDDPPSSWRCPKCRSPMTTLGHELEYELFELESVISSATKAGDVAALEAFLAKHLFPRGRLHPTHELVLDAKYALITRMYGKLKGFELKDLSGKQLNLATQHCRDYLKANDIAMPGYGLRMARVNLQLNQLLVEIVKRTAKLPPVELALSRMSEAEECLRKTEVAFAFSTDMRLELLRCRESTEHARCVLGLLSFAGVKLTEGK